MGLRILFVENDPTTADLLVPGLERKGYHATVASTQRRAMGYVRSRRPDILVVDVASFGDNGYRISEAVRARLENVPTILLLEQSHATVGSSADAFMTRPFTSRKLLYRVKRLAESMTSREIRAGSLALDPDSNVLRKGAEAMHLRPKEAALLGAFMRFSGRVLSRKELMKEVWETDYVGDTRTLSVHVRWLRLMIEEDPSAPRYLRTVRGVGYRFEVPGDDPSGP